MRMRQAKRGMIRRPSKRSLPSAPGRDGRWVFRGLGWLGLLLVLASSGCVERRLLIRSNPPGAMVYVDDYPVGVTPVGTNFTYYGTRKIRLVKDGYQTLTVYEKISPPWYQVPPLDFFSENLVREEIRDTRVLDYQLVPQAVAPSQQLLDRAEMLRNQAASQPPLPATGMTPAWSPQQNGGRISPQGGDFPPPNNPGPTFLSPATPRP